VIVGSFCTSSASGQIGTGASDGYNAAYENQEFPAPAGWDGFAIGCFTSGHASR